MIRSALILALLWLGGCSSVQQWMGVAEPVDDAPVIDEVPDGPPLIASVDVETLPEPVAKPEPLSQYGNPETYEVEASPTQSRLLAQGFLRLERQVGMGVNSMGNSPHQVNLLTCFSSPQRTRRCRSLRGFVSPI